MSAGRARLPFHWRAVFLLIAAPLAFAGCNPRDRLTAPDPGVPGAGPSSRIDRPMADTTVTEGPFFVITGYTKDDDQVDTIYFELIGGNETIPPFVLHEDSVRWGIPITTSGLGGHTVTFRTFATDRLGNRGDTASRQVTVQ